MFAPTAEGHKIGESWAPNLQWVAGIRTGIKISWTSGILNGCLGSW